MLKHHNPMTTTYGPISTRGLAIGTALAGILMSTATTASPPACAKSDMDRFLESDAVVAARVIDVERGEIDVRDERTRQDRRYRRARLDVRYRIEQVFRGALRPDEEIELHESCEIAPVPEHLYGYPQQQAYCPDGKQWLPGVREHEAGRRSASARVLFLDWYPGWEVVSGTGYGGCSRKGPGPTIEDRAGLARLRAWRETQRERTRRRQRPE